MTLPLSFRSPRRARRSSRAVASVVLAAVATASSLLAQDASSRVFDPDVMIPMRDGVRLAAHIFRPEEAGPHPVILMRTPYGKPGADFGEARRYTRAGFAMVVQDCRGKGASEGVWDPFAHDVEDGIDTQEWIGAQPWCDGTIGTAGGSYVGWTQWASAPDASRFLKCAVPVVPFGNAYDIAYRGGAFQLALLMGWGAGVGGVPLSGDGLESAYRHLPLESFGRQFEKPVSYLDDWIRHSTYDAYWKRRGIDHRYDAIGIPILNIGGWYDIFSKNTLDLVAGVRGGASDRLVRRNQFVIMGPWAHGPGVRTVGDLDFGPGAVRDLGELQFRWFRYWLQGAETGVEDWPAYHLFIMGENRWRSENEWPLARTEFTAIHLHSGGGANSLDGDGTLEWEAPSADQPVDTFLYDPGDPVPTAGGNNLIGAPIGPFDQSEVEKRPDVLVFTSAPLAEPLEATGPVKVILHAASSARDTDFTAKLVDVHPDGRAFNLCDGIVRARFRHGMEHEELLKPGAVERYEIDLGVTANVFLAGHRIRLEVSSSNFPRFDRNPNSGLRFGTDTELKTAEQTVFHDAARPSHLILPVIPR